MGSGGDLGGKEDEDAREAPRPLLALIPGPPPLRGPAPGSGLAFLQTLASP